MRTRPIQLDAALLFITYLYLDLIPSAVSNNTLCTIEEGWIWFTQFALQTKKLLAVFQSLPFLLATALGVTRSLPLVTTIIDVDVVVPESSNTDDIIFEALPESSHPPCTTIAAPKRKRRHSKTIAKPSKKRRLNSASEPTTATVNEEDVLHVTEGAKS